MARSRRIFSFTGYGSTIRLPALFGCGSYFSSCKTDKYYFQIKIPDCFKGIVSRNFGGLQIVLMNRAWVSDVLLEVYLILNFCFYLVV